MKDQLTPDMAMLFAYGLHLRNGGTYDSFMDMDMDDVQLLLTVEQCTERARDMRLLEGFAKLLSGALGGER